MRSSEDFLDTIDNLLYESHKKRSDLSKEIDVSTASISAWKARDTYPSIETASKIANFFNISLDWLINGELAPGFNDSNNYENKSSPKSIQYRMEIQIRGIYNETSHDSKKLHEKYLNDIIDYQSFNNWVLGRRTLDTLILKKISEKINCVLQWLLTGEAYFAEQYNENDIEHSKKYSDLLNFIDNATEDDRQFVIKYLQDMTVIRLLKEKGKLK